MSDELRVRLDETEHEIKILFEPATGAIPVVMLGEQGPPGSGNAFVHTQTSAAAEWIVNHNLGVRPSAEIYDNGGNVVEAQVLHISVNQLRVYFSSSRNGFARCI